MLQNLGSTLAGNTGIRFLGSGTVTEKAWMSSVKATYSMSNYTPGADRGPIQVWLCHSDYSLAEIEEYIENTVSESWDEGDLIARERNSRGRRIKFVGAFQPTSTSIATDTHVLNGGRMITTKANWMLQTGKGAVFVYYNTGSAALATTDPEVNINGHANLWPA